MKGLDGKNAEIFWFPHNTYIFETQRRVVRLVVEGEEKYGIERALRDVGFAKKAAFWMVLVLIVFSIIVVRAYDQKMERKGHE